MARIGLAPCSFPRLTHGVSRCLFRKTFCIHHALSLQAGALNSFLAKDCICYYLPHPPGKMLQIPSLTAGNTEIWLCKHIKGILTKREGCSHTGLHGHSALGKEFFPPEVVLWRQRHGFGRQNHIQQLRIRQAFHHLGSFTYAEHVVS